MFLLFQKRDFSSLVSDTFTFLKLEGKNYFKHFFKLCGIPLFLVLIFIYLLADMGISTAVSANYQRVTDPDLIFKTLFEEHLGLAILALLGIFVVGIILGIVCYSFPALYLKNMAETEPGQADQSTIGKQIMEKLGAIIVFGLGTTFLILPLILILAFVSTLLVFILIGIPILLLMIPTMYAVLTLAYYEYLTKNVGFFQAYGTAIRFVRYNFWSIIGNTFIFYMVTTLITLIPSMLIQFVILGGSVLFDTENLENSMMVSAITWGVVLLYFVYILLATFAQNIMFINQGIIYYSEREKVENRFTKSKIDSIGSNNE
ncbi:hypothetical protein [Myroides odoratus]|uniref:hypothetical protein n=1 Tax=Myroides odoratus TaxID=256 RepID=UPI0039B124BB